MVVVSLSSFSYDFTGFSFDLIPGACWVLRKLKYELFQWYPQKEVTVLVCSVLACSVAKQGLWYNWKQNTGRAYVHLRYYSGPRRLLYSICYKWCSDVLFGDCFQEKDGRKVCCCLIHYSRSVWCCLAEYFYFYDVPARTGWETHVSGGRWQYPPAVNLLFQVGIFEHSPWLCGYMRGIDRVLNAALNLLDSNTECVN